MSIRDVRTPSGDQGRTSGVCLELLTDDTDVWTVVPADATGDERVSQWLSVGAETLCELEEWR